MHGDARDYDLHGRATKHCICRAMIGKLAQPTRQPKECNSGVTYDSVRHCPKDPHRTRTADLDDLRWLSSLYLPADLVLQAKYARPECPGAALHSLAQRERPVPSECKRTEVAHARRAQYTARRNV